MTAHEWTASMIATFRALHRNGGSFAEIAAEMSAIFKLPITRNACIGKARRLELPMRNNERPRKPPPGPPKEPRKIQKPVHVAAPIEPEETIVPTDQLGGLTIYQLRSGVCHWPLGKMSDRPPYRYCGCEAAAELPYCEEHYQLGHHTPRKVWA